MEFLLKLLAAHFIGDFAFQNQWMVENKGKSWEVLTYHAATYTATFVWICQIYNPYAILLLLLSHIVIDTLKARYGAIKEIWQDQLLHGVVLAMFFIK